MNLVLFDPELGSFLDKLVSLPENYLKNLKFRNLNSDNIDLSVDINDNSTNGDSNTDNLTNDRSILVQNKKTQYKNCNKCYICKLELNLNEISHLICKLVKLGVRKLMVYLVLPNEKHLYSTITLNYVRCLYSRIIINYEHHFNDLNVINHKKVDITVLPLYNYQKLLENNIIVTKINLNKESNYDIPFYDNNNYIYLNNRFMFDDFYKLEHNQHTSVNNNSHTSSPSGSTNTSNLNRNTSSPRSSNTDDDYTTNSSEESVVAPDHFDCMSDNKTEDQTEESKETNSDENNNYLWLKLYDNVMFCGTFDHLHFGHKLLLLSAFLLFKKKLHIGVAASKELLSHKYNYKEIQPLETRKLYLKYYLSILFNIYKPEYINTETNGNDSSNTDDDYTTNSSEENIFRCTSIEFNLDTDSDFNDENKDDRDSNLNMYFKDDLNKDSYNLINFDNCDCIKIFDLFDAIGPASELKDKFGLLLTPELINNGIEVNKFRKNLNLMPWDLIIVGLVCYQSESKLIKLSSSTIRKFL